MTQYVRSYDSANLTWFPRLMVAGVLLVVGLIAYWALIATMLIALDSEGVYGNYEGYNPAELEAVAPEIERAQFNAGAIGGLAGVAASGVVAGIVTVIGGQSIGSISLSENRRRTIAAGLFGAAATYALVLGIVWLVRGTNEELPYFWALFGTALTVAGVLSALAAIALAKGSLGATHLARAAAIVPFFLFGIESLNLAKQGSSFIAGYADEPWGLDGNVYWLIPIAILAAVPWIVKSRPEVEQ